jgi:hypothetical protein
VPQSLSEAPGAKRPATDALLDNTQPDGISQGLVSGQVSLTWSSLGADQADPCDLPIGVAGRSLGGRALRRIGWRTSIANSSRVRGRAFALGVDGSVYRVPGLMVILCFGSGVYWRPSLCQWLGTLVLDGYMHRLGAFTTEEEAAGQVAIAARDLGLAKDGWSRFHGTAHE